MEKFTAFLKKQGVGFWITLATIVLAIVGFILYGSALGSGMGLSIANGSQPFYEADRDEDSLMMKAVVLCGIFALVALVVSLVLGQFEGKEGVVGKVCGIASDILRIVGPVLLMMAGIYFIYGSFTGLGWTFFSNSELVIAEQAIATGKTVITGVVFFLVASIAGIVGSFFKSHKVDEKVEVEE